MKKYIVLAIFVVSTVIFLYSLLDTETICQINATIRTGADFANIVEMCQP